MLSARALNRALLARQHLLERTASPLPDALEQVGGLQMQYAPSGYVGLWSRVAGLRRDDLTHALERREVVQATLLRSTIHLVSAADYWPMVLAVRQARRAAIRRTTPRLKQAEVERAADRLREALSGGAVLRRAEVDAVIGPGLLAPVGVELDLVRAPPSGTWERRRADLFADARSWLGPPPEGLTPADGVVLLVRRYLAAFGPATRAEVADWAGLGVADVEAALPSLEVTRARADDGAELLDLPGAPRPDPDTPVPVRLLPTWDATLLVHRRRTQILPDRHRPTVFTTRNPHSLAPVLVDGAVAATWRLDRGRVVVTALEELAERDRRAVDVEAERLAAFCA